MLNFYEMDQLLAQTKGEKCYEAISPELLKKLGASKAKSAQATVEPPQPPVAQAAEAPAPAAPAAPAPAQEPAATAAPAAPKVRRPRAPKPAAQATPPVIKSTTPDVNDPTNIQSVRSKDMESTATADQKAARQAKIMDKVAMLNSMIGTSPTYRFATWVALKNAKIPGIPADPTQDFAVVNKKGMGQGKPEVVVEDLGQLAKLTNAAMAVMGHGKRENMPREFSFLQHLAHDAIVPGEGGQFTVDKNKLGAVERAVDFYGKLGTVKPDTTMSIAELANDLGKQAGGAAPLMRQAMTQHQFGVQSHAPDRITDLEATLMLIKTDQKNNFGLFSVKPGQPLGPSAVVTVNPTRKQEFDPSLSKKPVADADVMARTRQALASRQAPQAPVQPEQVDGEQWSDLTSMMEHWGF